MKGSEYNKIKQGQIEYLTREVIEKRFEDGSIPLEKVAQLKERLKAIEDKHPTFADVYRIIDDADLTGNEALAKAVADLQKKAAEKDEEIVIEVTQKDTHKLISYNKGYLPRVMAVDKNGEKVVVSVFYSATDLVTIEWNNSFEGCLYVK